MLAYLGYSVWAGWAVVHVTACEIHVGLAWLKGWGNRADLDGGQGINSFSEGSSPPRLQILCHLWVTHLILRTLLGCVLDSSCVKGRTRLSRLSHLFNTTLFVAMSKIRAADTKSTKQPLFWEVDSLVRGGQLISRPFPTEWPYPHSYRVAQHCVVRLDYKASFWEILLLWSEYMCPPKTQLQKLNIQCNTFENRGL